MTSNPQDICQPDNLVLSNFLYFFSSLSLSDLSTATFHSLFISSPVSLALLLFLYIFSPSENPLQVSTV